MRKIIKNTIGILSIGILVLICWGFYEKNYGNYPMGDRLVGFGVLGTAFIVMPLFIGYRYSQKGIKKYIFQNPEGDSETENKS